MYFLVAFYYKAPLFLEIEPMSLLPRKKEIMFALMMTLISLALLVSTYNYSSESVYFPRFLMWLQIVFSLILWIRAIRLPSDPITVDQTAKTRLAIPFQIFTAISLYILAIEFIGYFVATILFLAGSMYLFGRHRWLVVVGVSVGFLLTIYILFGLLIGIRLPEGLLI